MLKHSNTQKLYGSVEAIPLVIVETDTVYLVVAMQGAQVLEFRTRGRDFFWLSSKAKYEFGKYIRGGLPICAPWFGVHSDPAKPKHGFVRSNLWELVEGSDHKLVFRYEHKGDVVFNHPFQMVYEVEFSESLTLRMTIENKGADIMPFSWAFHSYHPVADLASTSITGLEGVDYLDATDNFIKKHQNGPIYFDGQEIDSVYENVPKAQQIHGPLGLKIEGENCPTAIVWNAGPILAAKLPDVGPEGYKECICFERGAAFGDTWQVKAGEIKKANAIISIA